MSIIPVLRRLKQEDHEFKNSPDYIARPYLKPNQTKTPEIEISAIKVPLLPGHLFLFFLLPLQFCK
jgi:hypothetical protein